MARVTIEHSAFTDPRFRLLGDCYGAANFDAIGRLANIWSYCTDQKTYVLDPAIIDALAEIKNFHQYLLTATLGIRLETGQIRIKGTKGRVEWLSELQKSARKGGLAASAKRRAERNAKEVPNAVPNPSVLSISISSSKKYEEEEKNKESVCVVHNAVRQEERKAAHTHPVDAEQIKKAGETWRDTLRHFNMGRTLLAHEEAQLGRAIQMYGPVAVELALEGARYEPKDDRFDPSKFLQLTRVLDHKNFQRFLNLGTRKRNTA